MSTTISRNTIESTTFKNTNGSMVTLVMIKTENKIIYNLIVGEGKVSLEIEPQFMQSILH